MDSDKVGVWTSGVSLELFDTSRFSDSSKQLRRELGLENKFIVMYHGSLREELIEAILAIERLVSAHADIVLFILGSGLFEQKLRFLVDQKKLESHVYFHDAVDHERVPAFVAMCDVGIIPLTSNYWHGSALKLFEYLAMEKAIIATDLPFHREVFSHGNCGILVPLNDSGLIGSAIEQLYNHKDSLESMGKNGRRIVQKYYSWNSLARNFEDFVRDVHQ
jgi:glycosyltransferase involved in cell wall biosynthesis